MKLIMLSIGFILSIQEGIAQDSIQVVRDYINGKPGTWLDSFYFLGNPNSIIVSLDEGFDDSVYITVNDIPVIHAYLKTNQSIGYAGGLVISFKDSSEIKILKIKFVKADRYIREKVNLNYKSLEVRRLNSWYLEYSNHFYMRE